jgi:NDP-sugar pyrophosphorylase family protein
VLPYWVNAGAYVLSDEALDLLPLKGDHEESTFPQLARERRLVAYRHTGVWLTVNTPKDLRKARSYIRQYPNWLASMSDSVSRA